MRISNNVEMLEMEAVLVNGPGVIHPVLIWDENDVVLFDGGLPGMEAVFRQKAADACIPFERLNKVLITHSDMDHIGSLSQIIHEAGAEITVMAHKEEKPFIECELPPVRLKQMEAGLGSMTGVLREQMEALIENLRQNYRKLSVKVNKTIEDGELLPFCGGITGIHTPGHTPGHMCYYLEKFRLLIAGDILHIRNGVLTKCPDFTITDKADAANSLKKLLRYDIEAVVCYHGGFIRRNALQQISEMAAD